MYMKKKIKKKKRMYKSIKFFYWSSKKQKTKQVNSQKFNMQKIFLNVFYTLYMIYLLDAYVKKLSLVDKT